jgi:hypothetical protein
MRMRSRTLQESPVQNLREAQERRYRDEAQGWGCPAVAGSFLLQRYVFVQLCTLGAVLTARTARTAKQRSAVSLQRTVPWVQTPNALGTTVAHTQLVAWSEHRKQRTQDTQPLKSLLAVSCLANAVNGHMCLVAGQILLKDIELLASG